MELQSARACEGVNNDLKTREMLFKKPFRKSAVATQSPRNENCRSEGSAGQPVHANASQFFSRLAGRRSALWVHAVFRFVSGMAERSRSAAPARFVWVCKKDINHWAGSVRGWLCVCGTRLCVFCCVGILRLCGLPHQYSLLTRAAPLRLCS